MRMAKGILFFTQRISNPVGAYEIHGRPEEGGQSSPEIMRDSASSRRCALLCRCSRAP